MSENKGGDKNLKKHSKWIITAVVILSFLAILSLYPAELTDFFREYFVIPFTEDLGYNAANTIAWISLLIFVLYLIDRYFPYLLKYIDLKFFAIAGIYMISAAAMRVLEDANLFSEPLSYLFITPVIDVLIVLIWVMSILFAFLIKRSSKKQKWLPAMYSVIVLLALNLTYLAFYLSGPTSIKFIPSPMVFLLASLIPFVIYSVHYRYKKKLDPVLISSVGGLITVCFCSYFIAHWMLGNEWISVSKDLRPSILLIVVGLAVVITGLTYLIARYLRKRYGNASFFCNPINLSVIFAQLMDATATSIGIDRFSYIEKHWLPRILITQAEKLGLSYPATFVMLPIKLILVLVLLYFIDMLSRESESYTDPARLLKLVIFMIGLGPGIRDTLRIAMGI